MSLSASGTCSWCWKGRAVLAPYVLKAEAERTSQGRLEPGMRAIHVAILEDNFEAVQRVLQKIGVEPEHVQLRLQKVQETSEQKISKTMPGLETMYRKFFVQGWLTATDDAVLESLGAVD